MTRRKGFVAALLLGSTMVIAVGVVATSAAALVVGGVAFAVGLAGAVAGESAPRDEQDDAPREEEGEG